MVLVTGLAVVVGLGIVGTAVLSGPAPTPEPTRAVTLVSPPDRGWTVPQDGESLGSPDAPVVVEVWSDYQCPICGRFARDYLGRLVTEFVQPGTARIVEQSIDILGTGTPSESALSAAAADAAGAEDRYWEFHDWLFWNQAGENRGAFSRDRLVAMAERMELDLPAFERRLDSADARAAVASRTNAALAAGIRSTPTFVVNGRAIVGLVPYDVLAGAIRDAAAATTPP
jgi:protein-disulfide isomerase